MAFSSANFRAHLSVLTANLIYGANYTIAKNVMPEYIKPFPFIVIRVVVTTFLFFIAGLFLHHDKIQKQDWLRLVVCAFFGVALNQLLFFKGLDLTSPINAALMMTTNPIMVLIAAAVIAKEMITFRKIAGIAIGIVGAASLLLFGKTFHLNTGSLPGDVMVLINSLSFGVFLILVRPLMIKYPALLVMKWVFLFGSFMVIPFGFNGLADIRWETFTTEIWLGTAYVVIAVTALAYVLNTYALKNLSASSVSAYIYLQPLFATLIALMAGKDKLHYFHLIAALLIFTGVYLVTSPVTKNRNNLSAKKS